MTRAELAADKRAMIHELIDFAVEKVTKHRGIFLGGRGIINRIQHRGTAPLC